MWLRRREHEKNTFKYKMILYVLGNYDNIQVQNLDCWGEIMRVSQNVMEAMEERLENVFLPYRVIILIMKRLALLSAMQEEIIGG